MNFQRTEATMEGRRLLRFLGMGKIMGKGANFEHLDFPETKGPRDWPARRSRLEVKWLVTGSWESFRGLDRKFDSRASRRIRDSSHLLSTRLPRSHYPVPVSLPSRGTLGNYGMKRNKCWN